MKSKHFDELPNNIVELETELNRKPKKNSSDKADKAFCAVLFLILIIALAIYLVFLLNSYLTSYQKATPAERPPKKSPVRTHEKSQEVKISKFEELDLDSKYFSPLFTEDSDSDFYFARNQKFPPISLSKIAFLMSSTPKNYYLSKLYIDLWSTEYGSNAVKNTGIRPWINVYWGVSDINNPKPLFKNLLNYNQADDFSIEVFNETNHHLKWALMITDYMKKVSPDVEWFIIMDDDTLLFLDKTVKMLSEYKNPREKEYFIHSPGERISGTHLGNGGSSYIVSRKLMDAVLPSFENCVRHGVPRGNPNGDIKFDYCIRNLTGMLPTLDYGLFHMDPKVIKGDLTGFIEGYMDKMDFKALHHLNRKHLYFLYSPEFIHLMNKNALYNVHTENRRGQINLVYNYDTFSNLNNFYAPAHFVRSHCVSNDLFLKKYALKFEAKGEIYYGILNLGYSFVVFDSTLSSETLEKYLEGVETTFQFTENRLYENLSKLLKPRFTELKRFYNKANTVDPMHPSAFWQEYCSPTSLETVLTIYVDSNQKVYVNYFNKSLIF